jgi:hypothetical protein
LLAKDGYCKHRFSKAIFPPKLILNIKIYISNPATGAKKERFSGIKSEGRNP